MIQKPAYIFPPILGALELSQIEYPHNSYKTSLMHLTEQYLNVEDPCRTQAPVPRAAQGRRRKKCFHFTEVCALGGGGFICVRRF